MSDEAEPQDGGSQADFSQRLRWTYERLGGQQGVAERLGVSKGTPGRWARGESRMLLEDAAKLCDAADVSVEWLIYGGPIRSRSGQWVEANAVYDAAELILEVTKELGQPMEPARLAKTIRDRAVALTSERHPQGEGEGLTKTTNR